MAFQGFVSSHRRELERLWRGRLERLPERGIVISAGSPGTLANAFVSLQVLRHKLGCMLPVTVMYWGLEASDVPSAETIEFMKEHISDLSFVNASALPWPAWHRAFSADPHSWKHENGWKLKAFTLYAAPYKHVMFLDSDATAALDPAELFKNPEYRQAGSMFWPDLWCGGPALFEELGMPSIGQERQTESGIFLVDRTRHWLAVEWALWLNVITSRTSSLAFSQVTHPLGLMLQAVEGGYLNRGFLQAHPNGSSMFVHRVVRAKYEPGKDDLKPITHVTPPSCYYVVEMGWTHGQMPSEHFQPKVWTERTSKAKGTCRFSMHTMYHAARRCGHYDPDSAPGNQTLPVFEISRDGHVGSAIAATDAAFRLLRKAKQRAGPDSALFEVEPRGGDKD
ncbi:hypothetical protein C2E20_3484 [Micractinium conductrix]|uniref:Uncharacterized protein n=1 Tax=Micractinium conductrix TaxID=554055 RepID=A0A2P6VGT8_9CHLO|nr:hypothetical protein C2E20_3484 [Micractinium conductrix]|eukprot:PSC73304.1 hypothetical protein C2E20_3484 [Micractinium conductrix]